MRLFTIQSNQAIGQTVEKNAKTPSLQTSGSRVVACIRTVAVLMFVGFFGLKTWHNPSTLASTSSWSDTVQPGRQSVQKADVIDDIIDIIETVLGGGSSGGSGGNP